MSTASSPLRPRSPRKSNRFAAFAIQAAIALGLACNASGAETTATLRAWIAEGRAVEAEPELRALLATEGREETLRAAEILDLLVEATLARGVADSRECIDLAGRAVAIRERLQGARHADVGGSLICLGAAERIGSRFEDARKHLETALEILTETRGASDASTSKARMGVAAVYADLADYPRARAMYADELAALESASKPDARNLAKVLYSAARVARRAGDYRDAEKLYERALSIAEREIGAESQFVAYVLNGLANLRDDQARYAETRELYERALRIAESQGPDKPLTASCVNNLALVLKRLGDFETAGRYFRRSLEFERRTRHADHPYTASALANLAELEGLRGNLDEALSLAHEAREMRGRLYGAVHPEIAGSLRLEAMLERERGNAKASTELYEQALAIAEPTLGKDHAEVADLLGGLAMSLRESGDITRARATQARAVATCEKGVGADDPRTGDALRSLAALQFLGGDAPSAMTSATRAESISREHARLVVGALSESEALRYSEQREAARDLLITLFAEASGSASVDEVWNAVTRARSLVLDEISARHRSLAAEGGENVRSLSQQYATASRALAELLVAGPAADVAIYREAVDVARRQRDKTERQLAAGSASFRAHRARERVDLTQVRHALPKDCALVAYSRYEHGVTDATATPRYMAFVLRAGKPALAVPLGAATDIEPQVEAWVAAVSEPDSTAPGTGAFANAARRAGEELRRLVWDPLAAPVGDARTVLVVPDGALHRINFAALPRDEGGFLLDAGTRFHCLLAERAVVRESAENGAQGRGLLVVGGVEFSPATAVAGGGAASKPRFHFEPLPASAAEAKSVAEQWSVRVRATKDARDSALVLMGTEASEGAVKRLAPGRRAIHLATHGVFLGASSSALRSGTRGIGGVSSSERPRPSPPAPLLPLSGLVLAGANAGKAAGEAEDGILTAEEIAALDLSGTEWAVLSACDTGRGEVRPGEGVLGLRRAFEVTGVETLILSLWSVEDEPTRLWMNALYEARLARGLGTLESVDAANRVVLAERRAKGASDHPFYWAAFVAAGEWR